jgi:hypothetical protein
MLVYGAVAAFIAAVILIAASALSSTATPKVGFSVSLEIAGRKVTAAGTTYLADGRFGFESSRLSFAGRIEGDRVSIEGKAAPASPAKMHAFRAAGHIAGERMSTTVTGTDGRRLGTLRLELRSD